MLATAAVPSWRHTAGRLICVSSLWRTDWFAACKADTSASSLHLPNIHRSDLLRVTFCTNTKLSSLPPLRAGPVLSEQEVIGPTKSEFGPEPPCTEQSCKMAPGRKSETCARLAVSAAGNPLRSAPGPTLTADKHASTKHEDTQRDLGITFVFHCQSARGNHRTSDPVLPERSSCTGSNTKKMKNL